MEGTKGMKCYSCLKPIRWWQRIVVVCYRQLVFETTKAIVYIPRYAHVKCVDKEQKEICYITNYKPTGQAIYTTSIPVSNNLVNMTNPEE